ncbi:LXG domain-containing protein [Metabacillus mangrovi]|uniref:LXG domain-containing protein n=1 Tax=Metabacillus mangrovi TaxID=1491830 RepID=UPI001391C7AC|nr:LXG domain-containing protein [Metabacillus mangrovi]
MEKTLDVSNLQTGIDKITAKLVEKEEQLASIEKAITEFLSMKDELKGKTGEAILSFYQSCHVPFILNIKVLLKEYKNQLQQISKALNTLEPDESGFISQVSLEGSITDGIFNVLKVIIDHVENANSSIKSVSSIISLPMLDESGFRKEAANAHKHITTTIVNLTEFDQQRTKAVTTISDELTYTLQYLAEIETMFKGGKNVIPNFSIDQIKKNYIYQDYITDTSTKVEKYSGGVAASPELDKKFKNISSEVKKTMRVIDGTQRDGSGYVHGVETPKDAPVKMSAGFGYYKHDWNFSGSKDGDFVFGGSSTVSAFHAEGLHDTDVVDSRFKVDIGNASVTAKMGGNSWGDAPAPLFKAQAAGVNYKGRSQLDSKIKYFGRAGVEGNATVGSAKAYAGVDGSSWGIGAKAAGAEAEGSFIIPMPLIEDWNFKVTGGVSAGSIGGEAKVGMSTSIDISAGIGIKLGFSFEEQPK